MAGRLSGSDGIEVRDVDPADVAALEQRIELERACGRPRFELPALRRWLDETEALLVSATDQRGELLAAATASVLDLFPQTVQLNAFAQPGRRDAFRALIARVDAWERAAQAVELMAFVSDPNPAQDALWRDAGFSFEGMRTSLRLELGDGFVAPEVEPPEGVELLALRERPELASAALETWNRTHLDIPTAIAFDAVDHAGWLRELDMTEGDEFPEGLFVAIAGDEDVVGIALVNVTDPDQQLGGHRFTGVAPEWRGRGIARALKAATIRHAARSGMSALRATNDEGNPAMRAVNERFGYRAQHRIGLYRRIRT